MTTGRTVRGLAVAALLGMLAVLLWQLPQVHAPRPHAALSLTWWQLAAITVAAELVALHIQFRREVQSIAPGELAVVLGLFFADPATYLLGRTLGSLLVFTASRRQPPVKVLFNAALIAAESCLSLLVFNSIAGPGPAPDPRAWLAACAATAAVGCFGALAVTGAVALIETDIRWGVAATGLGRAMVGSQAATVAALVAVHAVQQSVIAAIPLAVSFGLLLLGFRAYSNLSERHLSLERLFRFSQVTTSTPEFDEILHGVLGQVREVLRSEQAEIVFVPSGPDQMPVRVDTHPDGRLRRGQLDRLEADDPVWAGVVAGGVPLLLPRGSREPELRAFLSSRRLRDAVLVPLHGDAGIVGTVLAGDRMGDVRGFDAEDVQLLVTVANQAGMALQNGQLVDRLRHEATHDPMTGLPNRSQLNRAMSEALADVRSRRSPGLAVLVLDLVGFKQVNDTLGHQLGDLLLREVGERLSGALVEPHTLARLGGDEFAVLLPAVLQPEAAVAAARRLQESLEHPITILDLDVEVGITTGISLAPRHGMEPNLLVKHADAAMYQAKSTGTGTQVYDASLDTAVSPERLALMGELRQGIQAGQLELFYQPQARLDSGAVVGAEALVRWRHPSRGLLFPDEFITLAERSGLIRPLTTAVLAEAVAACGRWRASGRQLSIAVNLSARSIVDVDLAETVSALLALHEVPPQALTLEITESSIIADPTRTLEVLQALHRMGVRLSIDDFGTGYSSLSYLKQLPVQEVKVDKSFVMTMLSEEDDATIVRSIVDLGANLGLAVVAEGVEDEGTRDELARIGCDLMQGYLLSRPLPAADFVAWLQARDGVPAPRAAQRGVTTGLPSTPTPSSSTSTR